MKSQLLLLSCCEQLSKISKQPCTMSVAHNNKTYVPGSGGWIDTPNITMSVTMDAKTLFKETHVKDPKKEWNELEVKESLAEKILFMAFTMGANAAHLK